MTGMSVFDVIRRSKYGNLYMEWVGEGGAIGSDVKYVDFYYSLDSGYDRKVLFRLDREDLYYIKDVAGVTDITASNMHVEVVCEEKSSFRTCNTIKVKYGELTLFDIYEIIPHPGMINFYDDLQIEVEDKVLVRFTPYTMDKENTEREPRSFKI